YTRKELDDLCRLIQKVQPNQDDDMAIFRQTHIVGLLSVHPKKKRAALQKQCILEGWSSAKLEEEIGTHFGTRREGGRARQVPSRPARLLTQLEGMCESWRRWRRRVKEENIAVPRRLAAEVEAVCAEVLGLQKKVLAALKELQPGREVRDLSDADEDGK